LATFLVILGDFLGYIDRRDLQADWRYSSVHLGLLLSE